MATAAPAKVLQHKTQTAPQRRFWLSHAKYRCFVGGVGSGKTRAGSVEVLRMPAGSTGMVLAPTYPMLRDATLRTFLSLVERAGILTTFNKAEMVAHLSDGKTVMFRSADNPDRLRGPNLGWFWLDEAALMDRDVWLIMLGRLREAPGLAWATTTPRGFNWLHDVFSGGGDHEIIRSSSRDNSFLPAEFVASLEKAYTTEFARQEIEGEFAEPAGAIFKRSWFTVAERVPDGLSWVRYWDLAASTKESADYTASAAVALAADGTLYIRDMIRDRFEWPDAKAVIMQTMKAEPGVQHGIEEALHGLAAVQDLHRERSIAHIALRGIRVDKDKVSRALPWAARAEQGKVVLVRGPWIEQFLAEVCAFPLAEHDDQVDTVSGGLAMVAAPEVKIRWID
jgi:predicted phage terminase large subunit-like protein